MIGPGRRWSYAAVARSTGIDVRSLKAYVQGTACPNLVRYKRMLAALGPEIGHELNVMQGMLPRHDASPPEALDLITLQRQLARATTILSTALRKPAGHARVATEAAPPGVADFSDETPAEFRRVLTARKIDKKAQTSRFGYRLRRMIGRGQRWSLAEVAAATEIDVRTLRAYVDGAACPNLTRYLRLIQVLGPESGFELALMLGWQPRHRPPTRIPRDAVETLHGALSDAVAALDDLIEGTGGQRVGLISPADRPADAVSKDSAALRPPASLRLPRS
jgi:hypothetical protein